jgi:hypothetical protein
MVSTDFPSVFVRMARFISPNSADFGSSSLDAIVAVALARTSSEVSAGRVNGGSSTFDAQGSPLVAAGSAFGAAGLTLVAAGFTLVAADLTVVVVVDFVMSMTSATRWRGFADEGFSVAATFDLGFDVGSDASPGSNVWLAELLS